MKTENSKQKSISIQYLRIPKLPDIYAIYFADDRILCYNQSCHSDAKIVQIA